ncbi:MAG: HEAT repeat domain-containing protein [Planctomycetota bacterium]|nr:HEAT repeat domain-containing protein [Planctomycetota bacterium]
MFFSLLSLLALAAFFVGHNTRSAAEAPPDVSISFEPVTLFPTMSKMTFPARSIPTPPVSYPSPPVPTFSRIAPVEGPVLPSNNFEWFNWWQINVSYLLDMRDEALFYRDIQVTKENVVQILALLDYSGVFYPTTRKIAIQCLEKLDDKGIEQLQRIASGDLGTRKNVHPSITNSKLQGLAAFALGHLRSRDSLDIIVKLAETSKPNVRMLAVLALGHLGIEESETKLLEMLDDERDSRVAASILIGLALVGSERSRKALLEAAETLKNNPTKQAFAYIALSLIMNKPSTADINRAAFSNDSAYWLSGVTAKAILMSKRELDARDVDKLIELTLLHAEGISEMSAIMPLFMLEENLSASDLQKLLRHMDPKVRAMTRFLAALSGSPDMAAAVVDRAADEDSDAAYMQSLALAYLAAPDRGSFAKKMLREKHLAAKVAGVLAHGEYMQKSDLRELRAYADNRNSSRSSSLTCSRSAGLPRGCLPPGTNSSANCVRLTVLSRTLLWCS